MHGKPFQGKNGSTAENGTTITNSNLFKKLYSWPFMYTIKSGKRGGG
jgi:hypothetical protein